MAPVQALNVTVLGGGGVGKSCVTCQFVFGHFADGYDPTIEDSYRQQIRVPYRPGGKDGEVVHMEVLDTAGQADYSAMADQWIRTGKGYLLVFDLTSRGSFDEMGSFVQRIRRVRDLPDGSTIGTAVPLVLVGNKADLAEEGRRVVSEQEGNDLAKLWGCPYIETSAKTAQNVDEAFFQLVRSVWSHEDGGSKKGRGRSSSGGSSGGDGSSPARGVKRGRKPPCAIL